MIKIFLSLLICLVINGFILVEEELLIILASILWVYAAGRLIKSIILSELVYKGATVKKKYLWFLKKKVLYHDVVIRTYYVRIYRFLRAERETAQHFLFGVIDNNIQYFMNNFILLEKFDINLKLYLIGLGIIKEVYLEDISHVINILVENKMHVNKYSTVEYVTKNIGNFNNTVNEYV